MMRRLNPFLFLVLAVLVLAGCERGPDEARLAQDLQAQLDRSFAADLLDVVWLRRAGSAPEASADGDEAAAVVYFDAAIELRRDYDFTAWDSPGAAALAGLLGATEAGLRGIAQGGNAAGTRLETHGSVRYRLSNGTWQPRAYLEAPRTTPVALDNVTPPSRALGLLERIETLLRGAELDALGPEGQIITYELEVAWNTIERRLDRFRSVYGFASGPQDGEYWQLAHAYDRFFTEDGARVANLDTSGSVENARLLGDQEADLALMQSDIAAFAHRGEGPFAHQAPLAELRALASLYPEPLHVVVMSDAGIESLADLAGRWVELGPLGSGTRSNAVAVLRAHGLQTSDLAGVGRRPLSEALLALAGGEAAAVFATIGVPAGTIRDFLARHDARLLALDPAATEQVAAAVPGLVTFAIPAHSYFGQTAPVPTVSATALLVALRSMPDGEVAALLEATFSRMNFLALGSFQGTRISRARAGEGIDLPLHPAAEAFFADDGLSDPASR